jgi:hypothetical protein
MCADHSAERVRKRAAYLAGFVKHPASNTVLSVHTAAPDWALQTLKDALDSVHSMVTQALGLPCSPPPVYVYPTVHALHAHACVGATAVAYYDGAIHLTPLMPQSQGPVRTGDLAWHELRISLTHEYVHHVLVSNGIGKPIWFQEGAAMEVARSWPRDYRRIARENPIRLQQMVDGFSAGNAASGVFYARSAVMVEFLQRLCLKLKECGLPQLTAALKTGRATPHTLFDWAISQRASDLVRTSALPLWDDYVRLGDFAPETRDALLHRPDPR